MAGGEGGWWTFTVFVLICVVFGLAAHDFFSRANWVATSEYAVEYLLLAVGQTFVIATAGIDLSCGAILGFSAMLAAVIMSGLVNGHVNSLLVTIVGCLIAVLSQVSNLPAQIGTLGQTIWLGDWLPAIVVVAAVFTAWVWLLLSRTRFGMHTYVIGSNQLAAARAGVNVDRHLVKVYALSEPSLSRSW